MSTKGVGTFLINSVFSSGNLIFYEKTVGRTATGDVFTVGTAAVKVGGTSQDVDFQVYGTGSVSAIIDIGAATFTLVGIATATNGALTITNATATSSTTTGALIVTGGIATAADVFVGDDLFFASGGVINFDAGDVTLTHSANTLAMAGGNLTVAGTVGITVADAGLTVTCATLNATTGRVGYFSGSIAAPNLGDGYGAVEVDVTFTGTYAGISAALSAWVNVTGTGAVGSFIVAAQNNGIYADSGGNTGSTVIFGMRAQGILTDAPTVFAPFSINTSNRAVTALFHMTSNPDVGYLANAGTSGGKVGDVPLFCDGAGTQYFVRIYSARG